MANVVLILGNGFDVDLGLNSKYTDFINEEEWKKLCKGLISKFPDKFKQVSLLYHMQKAGDDPSLWFDVENEIYKYINANAFHENDSLKRIGQLSQSEFRLLREALYNYLQRISNEFEIKEEKWSYILLKTLIESSNKVNVYTFNYTNSCALCKLPEIDFTYIHGSLDDSDIVLGCERKGREYIPEPFSFMLKSNMISRPNNIIEKLYKANEVIFFGHSLNEFDFPYFKEFFEYICQPIDHELHLTFITKDEKSELDIRNNIQAQGIPVRNLYMSNIVPLFIHSIPEKLSKADEQIKFETLIQRIKWDL